MAKRSKCNHPPTPSAPNRVALTAPQPLTYSAPTSEDDYIWNVSPSPTNIPADLRARLADQVAEMEKVGHLAPLALIGGIGFASGSYPWDLGGSKYSPYTLAWLNPADTIVALSQALPLLP